MYSSNTSSFFGDSIMYQKIAKKITNCFINNGIINSCDREIYEYSYEVMISQTIYILIMILISLVFKALFESLYFFIGFFLCRKFSGGYHASTYTKCHVLFAINQIVFLFLLRLIKTEYFALTSFLFIIISVIIIFAIAPIDHPNKPFNKKEFLKYKKRSRLFASLLTPIYILVYIIDKNNLFCFCFSIGIFSVCVSLLYSFLERRNKPNEKV
jgi:accessory gene regulator B